jgi:lysophospholipase L1-like esterase
MNMQNTKEDINSKKKTPASVFITVLFVILFIIQEVLFRLIFPVPEVSNFNRINYSPVFFGSNETELKYLSNASFIWASDPDKTESQINLNIYGFRGKDFCIESNPEIPRVVFIGDSFTEGYLAADNETIPVVFENEAKSKSKDIEVINLGIGGTDFASYLKILGAQMPVLKPDHVIIMLHGNDLPPQQFNPEYFQKPLEPEFNNWWTPRVINVLMNYFADKTVPKSWISKPFIFFAPVPAPSNPFSNSQKSARIESKIRKDIADAMKKGRFNPFAYDEYSLLHTRLPETFKITEHLNGIQNYVEQFGKKVYLVYIPSKNQVSDYYVPYIKDFSTDSTVIPLTTPEFQLHASILETSCKSLGIPFLDCTSMILEQENKGNHLYWEYDAHMRPKGYSVLAKGIYNWWKKAKSE